MRKQTKLVAVLSAAALLAIGASMTSFAATGWVEENGTWVFYEKNGELSTEKWQKSNGIWYWLDENGEIGSDVLVEYEDDYYYADANGAMVVNQWREIPNEDYDGEDESEPMNWWYYFGNNGKAYRTANSNTNASFKTINGHKYIFREDGKMLYGWISWDGQQQTGDEAWQNGVYYCGDEHDGRQRNNEWAYLDIVDTTFESVAPNSSSPYTFDDENQTRWFWFLSNGRKVTNKPNYNVDGKGKRYSFDEYGRMNAEWVAPKATPDAVLASYGSASYAASFRYYGSPEDGARVTRGFFKVVPDYYLDSKDFNDDQERTYYANKDGNLVTSKLESISGKKYAFNKFGEMQTGLKAVELGTNNVINGIKANDNGTYPFDTEEGFKSNVNDLLDLGYKMYYFGSDGIMKTGKQTINIDGENYTFLFNKSGSNKGAGKNGPDNHKYYMGGMLLAAERSDKYAVIEIHTDSARPNDPSAARYKILTTDQFIEEIKDWTGTDDTNPDVDKYDTYYKVGNVPAGYSYKLVNTTGTVQKNKTKAKDGDGFCFDLSGENITRVYVES